MSDKPVYIAAALGAGVMLGIPMGAIAAANILPVTVGEGWANIGGAAVGVLGAFAIANWSANRNLRTMQAEKLKPAHRAVMFSLECIENANRSHRATFVNVITLKAKLASVMGDDNTWTEFSNNARWGMSAPDPKFGEIAKLAGGLDRKPMKSVQENLNIAEKELSWVYENMKGIISPSEIHKVSQVVELIKTARYNNELANGIITDCINQLSVSPPHVRPFQIKTILGADYLQISENLSKAIEKLSPLTKLI